MGVYKDHFKLGSKPEEVITMDEAIVKNQKEIVNNYIITSNLEKIFNDVFHDLTMNTGKGFWVEGAYGSGKSHFMSYLTVLLHQNQLWDKVPENLQNEFRNKIKNKNYLTVNFTLSEINNLRVKIFDEIEMALKKDGKQIYIKNDKKIVDQFLEDEFDLLDKNKFYNIIKNELGVKKSVWDKNVNNKNINELAKIIIKYKQLTNQFSQKEYREIVYPSIKEGMEQIMVEIKKNYDGIVIFIDELSEFLQKKKSKGEEASTLETLQALGQRIKNDSFWVFAAVQKNPAEIIDESLYISDEEEKVIDRFKPLTLSKTDIEEIIDQRIVLKNKNDRKSIGKIYEELKKNLPSLEKDVSKEKFIRLYPFHHEFINAIIPLSTYGSRQRAVIRESWQIVNEKLNNEDDDLITIDLLYDIFKNDIIYKHFKNYYDLYENVYKLNIEKPGFNGEEYLIKRAIKALIILGITNKEDVSAKKLGQILMADMGFGLSLNLVFDEIYEGLNELYEKVNGKGINLDIKEEKNKTEGHIWSVKPGVSGINVEPEILSEMKHLNKTYLSNKIPDIININNHLLKDLKVSWNIPQKLDISFDWHHTEREGYVQLKNFNELEELPDLDPEKNIEFGLIMGYPFEDNLSVNEKEKICRDISKNNSRYLFWIPQVLKNESINDLKRLVAINRLLDKYKDSDEEESYEKQIQLESKLNSIRDKVVKEIEKSYFSGKIVTKYNKKEAKFFNGLKDFVENFLTEIFNDVYPLHPKFKRNIGRRQTNKLIREFVIPNINKKYINEIENIAEPLDIVEQENGKFKLDLNNDIFHEISKILNDEEWHETEEIYRFLRNEPYGFKEEIVEVLLSALIANGECRAKINKGENLNSENFTVNMIGGKHLINRLEAISKGKLVNNNIWNEIIQIMKIMNLEPKENKTMINQDKNWKKINNGLSKLANEFREGLNYLLELGGELGQFEKFENNLSVLKNMRDFLEEINKSKIIESSKGLKRVRRKVLEKFNKISMFQEKLVRAKKITSLIDDRIDNQLLNEYKYFNRIKEEIKENGIKNIIDKFNELYEIIDKPTKIKEFIQKVQKVKEKYIEKYISKHNQYHQDYQKFMEKIKKLEEYKTLKKLNKIKRVNIYPSLEEKINNIKENYFPTCNLKLEKKILEDKPHCPSCNFKLNNNFNEISINKIRGFLHENIKKYIKKLKNESLMKQINIYIEDHPDCLLKEIDNVKPYEIDSINELVNDKFILELNEAFEGSYPININVDEITSYFKGTIPAENIGEVTNKVENYLKEKIKNEISENEGVDKERIVLYIE